MKTDPRIDDYIARAAPFAQPILRHLRMRAHDVLPEAEEGIKWSMPTLMVEGRNVVSIAAFATHCSCVIHHEEQDRNGEGMGQLGKIADLENLPPDDELIARFRRGAERAAAGKRRVTNAKPVIAMPEDFAQALAAAPAARAVYDDFTDAQRREYLKWITTAKREGSRSKRIETSVAWLAEGKRRNWKYENC